MDSRKTITFIYPQMVMGGAEKVLLNFLFAIDRGKYDVNVVLLKHGGELVHGFPSDVRVMYAETPSLGFLLRNLGILAFLRGAYYRLRIRLARCYETESIWSAKCVVMPLDISKDCVVCYTHFNFRSIYLTAQCHARQKIFWVHNVFRDNMNIQLYQQALRFFSHVFCVSQATKDEFTEKFPLFSDRAQVMYNILDTEDIQKKAYAEISEKMNSTALVTVGRLSIEKGVLLVPAVCKRLSELGYHIYWYWIGDGDLRSQAEQKIAELGLSNQLFLLGNKANPYPYMKQCDIYVQPSSYEGFCTTISEAKVLCKPIVVSDISSFHEQITDGENGIIAPLTVEGLTDGIRRLLDSRQLCNQVAENLAHAGCNNLAELTKFYNILD